MNTSRNIGSGETGDNGFASSELADMLRGYWRIVFLNKALRVTVRKILKISGTMLALLLFFSIFLYVVPFLQEAGRAKTRIDGSTAHISNDPGYMDRIAALRNEVKYLSGKYDLLTPGQSYLVINTTENRFSLYRNKKLVREGFCSSGSYTRLTTPEGSRQWTFKTPKGMFRVQGKIIKPMWIRPDWSFVEEGLPVPPADDESRYEYGVLGDYALSLGDGYLIHGTLYKRFLGMPVTHGCVRLNDDDLEIIYRTLFIGSKVYIF